jgi:hypothetical protein
VKAMIQIAPSRQNRHKNNADECAFGVLNERMHE